VYRPAGAPLSDPGRTDNENEISQIKPLKQCPSPGPLFGQKIEPRREGYKPPPPVAVGGSTTVAMAGGVVAVPASGKGDGAWAALRALCNDLGGHRGGGAGFTGTQGCRRGAVGLAVPLPSQGPDWRPGDPTTEGCWKYKPFFNSRVMGPPPHLPGGVGGGSANGHKNKPG